MSDPASTTIAATAAGITVLGVTTGLHPELLVAGAAGGWWAVTYLPPMPPLSRVNRVMLSSVVAAWIAPAAIGLAEHVGWLPAIAPQRVLELIAALGIGLLTIDVLGGGVLTFARRWIVRREGDSK